MTAPQSFTTSADQRLITKVEVPGKVILSGEHAVVYGTKALACAIQNYACARVEDIDLAGVRLTITDFAIDQHYTLLQLQNLALQTQARHQGFVEAHVTLDQVIQSPAAFFASALGASSVLELGKPNQGLHVNLTTDLVVGGGMGSSAAFIAAMLAAVFKHLGQQLSNQALIAKTTESENWQHGNSSGLDPFVCVTGGLQEYQLGKGVVRHIGALTQSYLVSTGRPQSSTGACVEAVKNNTFDAGLWQQFACVEAAMLQALEQSSASDLGNAVMQNHRLLEYIGVVPAVVSEFIQHVEQRGGAAKICGAGSVAGDQGGLVWVVGIEAVVIATLSQQFGYGYKSMVPDTQGIRYVE